jgi:hypothetical protein
MKEGCKIDGNFATVFETYSMPGMRRGCENGLYGKFGLIQLEVRKLNLLAVRDPGVGAVKNDPVMLFEREYRYCVDGFKFFSVTGYV